MGWVFLNHLVFKGKMTTKIMKIWFTQYVYFVGFGWFYFYLILPFPLYFISLSKIAKSLEWVAFGIQNWIFFIKSILEWENSFSLGGRKIEWKKFICSKRNKLEWENALKVVEWNFIHELKYQKVEVGGRDYCNDVFCNHKG